MKIHYLSRMIKQKRGTSTCGQCCVATILNIPYESAVKLIGHEKATKSRELKANLILGSNKRGLPKGDGLCILRFDDSGNWHWIVKMGDGIYDPLRGKIIDSDAYFKKYYWTRVTSHFPIL